MHVLVTGGAGYIGSAAVKMLIDTGHTVTIVDNMVKGQQRLIHPKAMFHQVDLVDKQQLEKVFDKKFDAVMHFAGYKSVNESVRDPQKYSQNITGTINLLDCMVKHAVQKIIFSSSAAVYGEPLTPVVTEEHPTKPINYYGAGKLMCEQIIHYYAKTHNLVGINLRYFNVIGDVGYNYKDPNAENIMPIIEQVVNGNRSSLTIYGNDYDTRDGTCVRDYIDLHDLVHAHILALSLDKSETLNLGTGKGTTVLELVRYYENTHNVKVTYTIGARRDGDPASITASYDKAKRILGWEPKSI